MSYKLLHTTPTSALFYLTCSCNTMNAKPNNILCKEALLKLRPFNYNQMLYILIIHNLYPLF